MLNISDVEARYPTAFYALPEPYQADSCLEFYVESGKLFAQPSKEERKVLGNWLASFSLLPAATEWVEERVKR